MKVSYDKDIDAKYVSIKDGAVHQTKALEDWLMLDLDAEGGVLGVEILDASRNRVNLFTDGTDLAYLEVGQLSKTAPDDFGVTLESETPLRSGPLSVFVA